MKKAQYIMEERSRMAKIKNGDTIKVHYEGKLDDGSVFDSSKDHDPIQFEVGKGQVIPGFEEAVVGMNQGDTKTVKISSDKAYGPSREEMIQIIDRSQIPPNIELEMGQQLRVNGPGGQPVIVKIVDVSEATVTLDGNHPLAGKDLTFEIEVVDVS
jgi:peptidylprolyl isomerase